MKLDRGALFLFCIALALGQFGCFAAGGESASTPYYGSGIGSDGLANTTLGPNGNMVSYRIRAKHSGVLEQIRIYLIPDHVNYAAGTGGIIDVTLHPDDGTPAHEPSSTVIASHVISDVLSLPSADRHFYLLKFAVPPAIIAGHIYHLVFKNVDAHPAANFLSVDDLYQASPIVSQNQPTMTDDDAAVLLSNSGGSSWKMRPGFTPIYQFYMQSGVCEGIGYMEGWVGAPRIISGRRAVREAFTVTGSEVKVNSVSIRLSRISGNNPLVVRLENANGTLIEEGSIPAVDIPQTSEGKPVWAKFVFGATYALLPGHTYHLDFEASSTSTYEAFPIRKGAAYGFNDTTYFAAGHAEFIENGSWMGWTQWGVANRTDGDLQFYFTVVP